MCGIAGIWDRDGRPVAKAEIQRMNDLQAHRGPDGEGIWMRPDLGLGHPHRAGMDRSAMFDAGHDILGVIDRLRGTLGPGDAVLVKGRDTERLDRIALALTGSDVRCTIRFCDAKVTRCHHCKMLETGWPEDAASAS